MQSITGWFKGSAPDNEPPASVLAEWNTYAGKPNTSGTSQTDNLLSAEEGASSMGRLVSSTFTSALSSVTSAATGAASTVNASVQRLDKY